MNAMFIPGLDLNEQFFHEVVPPLPTRCVPFHERPFQVIDAEHFTPAILKTIKDAPIRQLSTKIGSIDQFSHSTDL